MGPAGRALETPAVAVARDAAAVYCPAVPGPGAYPAGMGRLIAPAWRPLALAAGAWLGVLAVLGAGAALAGAGRLWPS